MKKLLIAVSLGMLSSTAFAEAAGGNGCGWGNLLFDGQSGKVSHVLAVTTNGSTGNNTIGITSGTNGCSGAGTINYGGKEVVQVGAVIDEFSEDVARGEGEILTAMAVTLGISQEDRAYFKQTMQQNFATIFPTQDASQEDVLAGMWQVLGEDKVLSKYI